MDIKDFALAALPVAGFGDTVRYAVSLNGVKVAEVYRYEGSTVKTYSGKMYGRTVAVYEWVLSGNVKRTRTDGSTYNVRLDSLGGRRYRKDALALLAEML